MSNRMKVVFSDKMVAVSGNTFSPSSEKPGLMAAYLKHHPVPYLEIEFADPEPVSFEDICKCHEESYVRDIFAMKRPNGFGTLSQSVCDSLPYTNGSMLTAARLATKDLPAAALSSGFHHAEYRGQPASFAFCTFNGLMVAAIKLAAEGKQVSIIDCDMHYGNGTDNIIKVLSLRKGIMPERLLIGTLAGPYHHVTFGYFFSNPNHASAYLANFTSVRYELEAVKPDIILYQSGADVHVDDPAGGVLTEEEMYRRDLEMFKIAKDLGIPLVWNLAGGYQKAADGSIDKVLNLHWNTFKACGAVYREAQNTASTPTA